MPVLLLVGLGLLTTGIVSLFVASQSTSGNPPSNPSADVAATSILPTATPSLSPAVTAPQNTSPTSTPTPVPAAGPGRTQPEVEEPTPILSEVQEPISPLNVSPNLSFSGDVAYQHVLAQIAIGPRPTGSDAGWATGNFIIAELDKAGWSAESQEFLFKGVKGRNIIGRKGSGPIIIIGAHYDTRPAADQEQDAALRAEWIDGANDGASGVAVLLELARVLDSETLKNEVWLAFFDAEDRGRLDGWPFSVGARQMAQELTVNPQAVVVVDMIGDAGQQLYYEHNSTDELSIEIWAVAAELGYQDHFIPEFRHTIIDDHIPFLERLIPAVDIIDFDYPYWHTVEDTADKVSPESLERVGRTLQVWLEEKQ